MPLRTLDTFCLALLPEASTYSEGQDAAQPPSVPSLQPRAMTLSSWGFLPEWADGRRDVKPLINARAETVATKPFFRQAFRTRRCLVLADGFYEWKRAGRDKLPVQLPYRIALQTAEPFAFAGIWSVVHDAQGRPRTTCAILTTDANALVAQVHTRMPVILQPQDEAAWLDPEVSPQQAQAFLVPFPAALLRAYPVSARVNAPTWNRPEALAPVTQDAAGGHTPGHGADGCETEPA